MRAPEDRLTGLQSLMRRTMTPWEHRHLRGVASVRFVAGGFSLGLGLVLVSLGRQATTSRDRRKCYGFAAWFLVAAPLQLLGGYLEMKIADSARRSALTESPVAAENSAGPGSFMTRS
jgi:hypothetical protein